LRGRDRGVRDRVGDAVISGPPAQDTLAGVNRIRSQTSVQPSTLREPSPAQANPIQHRDRIRVSGGHATRDRNGDASIASIAGAGRSLRHESTRPLLLSPYDCEGDVRIVPVGLGGQSNPGAGRRGLLVVDRTTTLGTRATRRSFRSGASVRATALTRLRSAWRSGAALPHAALCRKDENLRPGQDHRGCALTPGCYEGWDPIRSRPPAVGLAVPSALVCGEVDRRPRVRSRREGQRSRARVGRC
jgi:hypothetical protein